MAKMTKKKKLSVNEAAAKLAAIAEKSLSRFSDKEQDARVEAFARRDFSGTRETRAKSSRSSRTRATRQLAEVVNDCIYKSSFVVTLQRLFKFPAQHRSPPHLGNAGRLPLA